MKCKKCDGTLRIVKTFLASRYDKTQEARCLSCGTRWTLISMVFCEINGYGKGAAAVASKLPRMRNDGSIGSTPSSLL